MSSESSDDRPPEEQAPHEESRKEDHISFIQRVQRHFGHDVQPITLQSQFEEDEAEGEEAAPVEEPSTPSLGLVKKLAEKVGLGPRYQVSRELARGGMGTIMRVWDEDLRRNLAMKVMHGRGRVDQESGSSDIDREKLGRFLEEAQITGQLDHPGIVPVHDLGIDDNGQCYFTMRLVRGRELKEVLDLAREEKEGWTQTKALNLILKVCESMAYAHSKGVVHRDLKPSNIMVGRFGEVYVMDWGLARVLGRRDSHDIRLRPEPEDASAMSLVRTVRKDESETNPDSPLITMDGDVVGTPSYMAVEQAQGKLDEVGPRSDVYSLGSILYYMLTGRAPYVKPGERVSPHTVLNRVLKEPPDPVSKFARDVPAELLAICDKSMERGASDRYGSMLEVADDIQAYLEDRVVSAYEGGSLAEFRKWVARNRGMAAGIAGMITLSIASALGFGIQKQSQVDALNEEKAETAVARDEADRNADRLSDALEVAQAKEQEATASALTAAIKELEARRSGYMANITAADYSLKLNDVREARDRIRNSDLRMRAWEWEHLRLRANPALRTLGSMGLGGVDEVATTPDGSVVLSLSRHGRVYFNEIDTRERVAPGLLTAMVVPLSGAVFAPLRMDLTTDGTQLAVVGYKKRIRIFDVLAGEGEPILDLPKTGTRGHESRVTSVAFSRDGRYLLSGAVNGTIIQWDALGDRVHIYQGHREEITDLAWSPDSRFVASASVDGSVFVSDASVGQREQELRGHQERVNALAWDFTGTRLFSAGADRIINAWDADDGRLTASFSGHTDAVNSIDYDPVRERLVSGGADQTVRIWDVNTGQELALLRGHEAAVNDVAFTPDGNDVVSSDADGEVLVWDARGDLAETDLILGDWLEADSGGEQAAQGDAERSVDCVAYHGDGVRAATAGGRPGDPELLIWDTMSGEPLRRLRGHENAITDVTFSPDGKWLFSSSVDRTVRRWDAETGQLSNIYRHDTGINVMALSLDGTRLITGGLDKVVRVLDSETGDVLLELTGHRRAPFSIAVAPDGETFATSGLELRIWNLRSQEPVLVYPKQKNAILSIDYSPDGSRIVGTLLRGDLLVWDARRSSEPILKDADPDLRLRALDYSPDGKRIATGGRDATIHIRDADRVGTLLALEWEGADITAVEFSPDGKRLLASSKDGRVRIWETGNVPARRAASLQALELREPAEALVAELFHRRFYLQDVVLALQDDSELEPGLRQMAVRLANLWGNDPARLVRSSIADAIAPGQAPEVYARARDRALAARDLEGSPTSVRVWLSLGMTQYRAGDYRSATRSLERASLDEEATLSSIDETERLLFLAMAQFREGRTSGANVSLTLANVRMEEDPRLRFNQFLEDLLEEAQTLILRDA